ALVRTPLDTLFDYTTLFGSAAAPRLANVITRSPHVFGALLDPALLSELPNKTYLAGRLKVFLEGVTQHEEILDRLRIFNNEQRLDRKSTRLNCSHVKIS